MAITHRSTVLAGLLAATLSAGLLSDSDADFSPGTCPECRDKQFPDIPDEVPGHTQNQA